MSAMRAGPNRAASVPPQIIRPARVLGAVLAVMISFDVWHHIFSQPPTHIRLWLLLVALMVGMIPAPAGSFRGKPVFQRRLRGVSDLFVAILSTLGTATGVAWIAEQGPPAGLVFLVLIFMAVLIPVARRLAERLSSVPTAERSYVVYGHNELGLAVAQYLIRVQSGSKIVGFIDECGGTLDTQTSSVPVFRDLTEMSAALPDLVVDGVVIALPAASVEEIASVRAKLRQRIPRILLAPPMAVMSAQWPIALETATPHCYVLGAKEFAFDVRVAKRAIDIVVACVALVVFAPIMLVFAVLIKMESPGPVIFRQRRFTTDNRLFDCYKLRTMRTAPPTDRIELTLRRDSRVTYVGSFLRRTSLDEIPQFINVLQGHMSVVGPRPHPPGVMAAGRTYEDIVTDFDERYKVKPGLTGFAQISGLRGNTFTAEDVEQRFRYDIEYINNWSLSLEFWIILKTFSNGFWGKNVF